MEETSHLYLDHYFLEERKKHIPKGNKQRRFCKDAKATTCMHIYQSLQVYLSPLGQLLEVPQSNSLTILWPCLFAAWIRIT